MLNLVIVNKPLGTHHFLNLEQHGLAVLKNEGHYRPNRDPAIPFGIHYSFAEFRSRLLVIGDIEKIGQRDWGCCVSVHFEKSGRMRSNYYILCVGKEFIKFSKPPK